MDIIDREKMKKKAIEQLKTGQSLFGKGGAFAPLLQEFLQEALEAEMDSFLTTEERNKGNKRNGRGKKTVKSTVGEIEVYPPQDRLYKHNPETLPKRETILADNLASKIIGLYGTGMSLRDIGKNIYEMYNTKISATTLLSIIERVTPKVKMWQGRPLKKTYPFMFLDVMYQKIKQDGTVINKAVYSVIGIDSEGIKDVLAVHVSKTESASFWMKVLSDLQNRGVEDVFIFCVDNLKGFKEAINAVFPKAEVQTCVVHQIRNSLRYVASKDKKAFMEDLKKVYKAPTKDVAEEQLKNLEKIWAKKYPFVIKSWLYNWEKLSVYFDYPSPIRRLIYTTNMIEGFHRQMRKVTKNKGAFQNDMGLLRLLFLAIQNASEKWQKPIQNWGIIAQQLAIKFGDRMKLNLNLENKRQS